MLPVTCVKIASLLAATLLGLTACSQSDPKSDEGEDAGTSTNGSGNYDERTSFHPLIDGASWTFRHDSPTDGVWTEELGIVAVTYEGKPAFEMDDTGDIANLKTISTLVRHDTQVLRIHKTESINDILLAEVDYDPGFLRFDDAWDKEGQKYTNTYERTETAGGITDPTENRTQDFTVLAVGETVKVGAGTFEDCIQVRRERIGETDLVEKEKIFWFAPGVGKVREENPNTGKIETLEEYDIPD